MAINNKQTSGSRFHFHSFLQQLSVFESNKGSWLNPHEVIQPRETSGWVQNGQVWVQAGASILNRVQFERDKSIKQTRKGFLKTFEQLYLFQKNKLLL